MAPNPPIQGTGLACVTDKQWSLRLYYQRVDSHVDEARHLNGVWTNSELTFKPVWASPLASVTYSGGKEIRVYYLDYDHTIHEFCYTEGKGWYDGAIKQLGAKATPAAGLAAVVFGDSKGGVHLRVYYQETGTLLIKELANDGSWYHGGLVIKGALGATALAAVAYNFQNQSQIRVYYQAADLSLHEYGHNNSGWFEGSFNPGKATAHTPLAALAFGSVELQVYWHDLGGHTVFAKNTGSWNNPTAIAPIEPNRHFTVLEWDNGKLIRFYYQSYGGNISELCSDNGGASWFPGSLKLLEN